MGKVRDNGFRGGVNGGEIGRGDTRTGGSERLYKMGKWGEGKVT